MLRRPEPGAPFDKRLTADTLSALLSAGPRPFDAARDVDLFDSIEEYLRVTLLSPAALSPYAYAAAQYATNQPATGWTLQGTPLEGPRSLLSAFPIPTPGAYRYGAALDGLPANGAEHTLPVDLPGAAFVARVSAAFRLGGATFGTTGSNGSGSYSRAECADTRYDVALIGPDGATVAELLDVAPRDARVTGTRKEEVFLGGPFPTYADFPAASLVDLPVGRVLNAGTYGVRFRLRTVRARISTGNGVTADVNAYPATATAGMVQVAPLTPSPAWPDGQRSAGAVLFDLDLTVPAAMTTTPTEARFTGAQLIRTGTPLGPSGSLASRWVCEFTLDDTPDVRAWGGQLSFIPTAYPDARIHDELPRLLAQTGGSYGGDNATLVYGDSLGRVDNMLTLVHPPRRDDNLWSFGVRGGERCRLEMTRRDVQVQLGTGGTTAGFTLGYRLYNEAGELLHALEQQFPGWFESAVASWRFAVLTHPGRRWLLGKPAPLTVHRWQEWRE